METTAESIEEKLKAFDSGHAQWMRKAGLWIGNFQKTFMNNPLGRFILRNFTTRLLASTVVRKKLLGIEKGASAPEIAYQWQKLAVFFGVPVEIESADDNEVVIVHPECTIGLDTRHEKLCRASMNLDHEIVRRLGGKLEIIETISSGAPRCKHRVKRA